MPIQIILLLSFVQGFAEFLPISSAGHLLLIEHWLKLPQNSLTFDLALNLGTLLTIIVYFRKDVCLVIKEAISIITLKPTSYSNLLITKLFIATIPVVIVGYLLVHFKLENILRSNHLILAVCLIIFGIILYLADIFSKSSTSFNQISYKNAFVIGITQCLALIPGVSRSGSTITAARLSKINKQDAVRFSFLMAIPSTFGAVLLAGLHGVKQGINFQLVDISLGVIFSFLFGLLFIHILLKFIANHSFMIFMIYRVILGLLIILFVSLQI